MAFCSCSLSHFILLPPPSLPIATFCGWRLGEGECSSQLQSYLCPAADSPQSAASPPPHLSSLPPLLCRRKEHPLFLKQPNLSRSLIRIGVILSLGGAGGMITAKAHEKAKCRWCLISLEEWHLLSLFLLPLYLMIPFPFRSRSSRCPVDPPLHFFISFSLIPFSLFHYLSSA